MKQQSAAIPAASSKILSIAALFAMSSAITISGAFFMVYAYLNHVTFKVLNTSVPGVVFGLCVLYLGVRYFISVFKLRKKIFEPGVEFSWSNFKKQKPAKSR